MIPGFLSCVCVYWRLRCRNTNGPKKISTWSRKTENPTRIVILTLKQRHKEGDSTVHFHIRGQFDRRWATFSPAIWPAPFCHKGSTSKQPRQVAQECGKVPWAAFVNILKAVPGLEMSWQWHRMNFEYKSASRNFSGFFLALKGAENSWAKLGYYWRKINLWNWTVLSQFQLQC